MNPIAPSQRVRATLPLRQPDRVSVDSGRFSITGSHGSVATTPRHTARVEALKEINTKGATL